MARRLIISRLAYLNIDRIVEFNNNRNKSDTYSKKLIRELYRKLIRSFESVYWNQNNGSSGSAIDLGSALHILAG